MNWTQLTLVCNGATFIEECVRSLASQMNQIIVVEGACLENPAGRGNGLRITGGKPNSTDGTVEILKRLEHEYPHLKVIYADGKPWGGKTEMCNAAMPYIKDGWIFQRDVDEFYFPSDVETLQALLSQRDEYTDVEFYARHFWPIIGYHTRMEDDWGNNPPWRRMFRFRQGDTWASHEPPRIKRKVKENVLSRNETRANGILLFHLGYVIEKQFRDRELFYGLPKGSLIEERKRWLVTRSTAGPVRQTVKYDAQYPISEKLMKELKEAK